MRQILLGAGLLGNGGDAVGSVPRFIGPPYYLVNDTFTTDRAAGAVNGTNAEPGPGRRVVIDSNGKLSLSGSNAVFATGGAGLGDPGIWYQAFLGVVGRLVKAEMSFSSGIIEVGLDNNSSGTPGQALRLGVTLQVRTPALLPVGNTTADVLYSVAITTGIERTHFFIKGGAFMAWSLLWSRPSALSSFFPALTAGNATTIGLVDYLRVPVALWLPTPLVSDGFSAWGVSDGLGHAEGIAGGLGAGGGGLTMTEYGGFWEAIGGTARCSALKMDSTALAGRDVGTADMIAAVKVTRGGGVAGLFVRENADDRVVAVHNGTNAQLIKRVSGVETTLVNVAATYVAGAELRLICEGTKFRLFYNNVAIGSEQTISDVSLQAETLAGLYTTDTSNSFDDFVVYARGTGGEYSALDAF